MLILALVLILTQREQGPRADLRNGRVYIQDNLWSTGRAQYAVWVAPDGTPYAGVRRAGAGTWRTVNLGRLRGNPLAAPTGDNEHNVYAIAADAGGDIHVAGNMLVAPLRYVRADGPRLRRWRTSPAPARTDANTYPAFTALPDGRLLFWRRTGTFGSGGGIALDALAPNASAWRPRGTLITGGRRETPYLHHIAVDPRSGVIHLLFEWRADPDVRSTNDVSYARSADGGRTWTTSRGTRLRLPMTHQRAENVIDTVPRGSGLVNSGGLTVDAHGRPHGALIFRRPGGGEVVDHVWLEGASWRRERLDKVDLEGRPQLAGTRDGRVWLIGRRGGWLRANDVTTGRKRLSPRRITRVPRGWEPSYDSQALARKGTVEMLIPQGSRPHVVVARLSGD